MAGDSATAAERAWVRQRLWSQAADRLKATPTRWRLVALWLTITGAVLATAAVAVGDAPSTVNRVLAFLGAAAVGLVPVIRSRFGPQAVRDWTRARSVSEGVKAEVYEFLARVGDYSGDDRQARLAARLEEIEGLADDLLRHVDTVHSVSRPLPDIRGIDDYLRLRVEEQIEGYYRRRAGELSRRLDSVRRGSYALGVVGALLAAAGGAFESSELTLWVPVVTTASAALVAWAAAERLEFLLVEFLRTAAQLERLCLRYRRGSLTDAQFVAACEQVISVQNEAWMAAKIGGAEEAH